MHPVVIPDVDEETRRAMLVEVWRCIPGFPGYEVSSFGKVRSYRRRGRGTTLATEPKPLIPRWEGDPRWPRLRVSLRRNGAYVHKYIHRLVMETFLGDLPPGMETRHLNGNPEDNHLINLAYGTSMENTDDARRHGTGPQGERHPCHILTEEEVREIRLLMEHEIFSAKKIAAIYGVTHQSVHHIVAGRTWAHLT